MAQSFLELVFRTLKQGTGGKAAAAELRELKGTVSEVSSGLLGFNLGTLSAAGAIVAVGAAAGKAVTDYQAYAESIRGLNAITGTGTEETSRLVQAFDDLGISQETVTSAMSVAAKKGFVATIDNVANLADKYNALSTQEEKNALLTKELGKGGLELAKALEQGGQAFRDAAAAQADGMLVTEQNMRAAEELRQKQDELNDSSQALANTFAKMIVPAELAVIDAANTYIEVLSNMEKAQGGVGGASFAVAISQKLEAESNKQVADNATRAYAAMAKLAQQNQESIPLLNEVATGWMAIPPTIQAYITSSDLAAAANGRLQDSLDLSMQKYSDQLQYQIATEGLSAESKQRVAEALGLVDAHTVAAMQATRDLKEKFEQGKISAGEYASELAAIRDTLGGINSKEVTIDIYIQEHNGRGGASSHGSEVYTGGYVDPGTGSGYSSGVTGGGQSGMTAAQIAAARAAATQAAASVYSNQPPTTPVDANGVQSHKANAGLFTVPPGYPNDSYLVGMSSGETARITNDRMRWTGQGGGGNAPVIQITGDIHINNGMDLATFEARLTQVLRLRG